jgi:hypothetical protein
METTKELGQVTSRVLRTREGYGLLVHIDGGESRLYPDLTSDYVRICVFSDLLNHGNVSSLHIDDMIEDFLE